jgi:hypothetical protein
MAKLTRSQRNTAEKALYHLRRAQDYINGPFVAVCRFGPATTSLHYVRNGDTKNALYPVAKFDSDLTGLEDAVRAIRVLLGDIG